MKRTRDRKSSGFRVERFVGGLDSAIGMPIDPNAIPEVRYQVLDGTVFLLQHWKDGSTLRGEIEMETLAQLIGAPPQEGWYDVTGAYLGSVLDLAWLRG